MTVTEKAARVSLRSDGRFCLLVGAVVAVASPALAEPLGLSVWLTALVGVVGAGWGGFVFRLAQTERWVTALTGVAAINFVAGMGIALFALTPGGARLRLFLGGLLALTVLWFAVSQALIRWNVTGGN